MKCSFCDNTLSVDMLREEGCGVCIGGCRKIHCPYCGQENPVIPEMLDKILQYGKSANKKGKVE